MTAFLRVKNWEKFQHYKDRDPPWIKLHVCLLDDYEFAKLSDEHKCHLMMLWLYSSKDDGRIPLDPKYLQAKIGLERAPDLDLLFANGWLVEDTEEPEKDEWASRYVSAELRSKLLLAAGHKCAACASAENLEIDHIVPISKGGNGEVSNLQVLCRSCNRRKRVRSMQNISAEQLATQTRHASVAQRHINKTETDIGPKRGKRKSELQSLPDDWTPSEATVKRLAIEFRLHIPEDVERYVAAFKDSCKAKGYRYKDFDAAFSNCVRQDWPKLRQGKETMQSNRVAMP